MNNLKDRLFETMRAYASARKCTIVLAMATFAIGGAVNAQAPSNNACANAIPLTCNSTISGTTVNSTSAGAPGNCITTLNTAGGVWYTVPGWNGDMIASLCGSSYNTKIGVYSGSCGALSCIKGNDDDNGPGGAAVCGGGVVSSTTWTAIAGTTYYIYVTGSGTATGEFDLQVTCGDTNSPCPENGLTLELQTDANGTQTSFEIVPEGMSIPVCSSTGFPSNAIITTDCCMPDGCYQLRVFDSAGDGMTTGGYILRTTGENDRVIDNRNNFSTGSVSAIANDGGFCLPIGEDRLIYTSCDKLDRVNDQFLVASMNPAVSAQWIDGAPNSQQDANSGYQFWFFDPNGSYSFVWFRRHSNSHGFGTGPARAAHLRINNWLATYHIPENVMMNVRVRGVVAGVPMEWGPACRFMIDPVAAECPTTKLMDIPYNQYLSCGEYREFTSGSYVHARPVSGATQYQFRFSQPAEGYEKIRTNNSYFTQLWWAVDPLMEGSQYNVDVRAFKDGQWCPWGEVCTLNIGVGPGAQGGAEQNASMGNAPISYVSQLKLWPNPNQGNAISIHMDHIPAHVQMIPVEVFDLTGQRVATHSLAVAHGTINTVLDLNEQLANGVYVINFTVGEKIMSQRLVVQN